MLHALPLADAVECIEPPGQQPCCKLSFSTLDTYIVKPGYRFDSLVGNLSLPPTRDGGGQSEAMRTI